MTAYDLKLFTGNANRPLAEKIAQHLGMQLEQAIVSCFADGETRVEIENNIRGADVYIIQSTCRPANQNLMEGVIMIDACRRASAKRITFVTPYFGYARQERKSAPRTPITAKLVADIITTAGADRIVALELHAAAIQGFFNIPFDHLFAKPVFAEYLKTKPFINDLLVVSPDAGGVERARALAKVFNAGLAIVDKRRDKPNSSEVMHIIGEVTGKYCLIVDDIVDTGGSLTKAADALMEAGALGVSAAISHPVLSQDAVAKINNSQIDELVVTDSIPLSAEAKASHKIRSLSIAPLLGEAIKRIHNSESISSLFV